MYRSLGKHELISITIVSQYLSVLLFFNSLGIFKLW